MCDFVKHNLLIFFSSFNTMTDYLMFKNDLFRRIEKLEKWLIELLIMKTELKIPRR